MKAKKEIGYICVVISSMFWGTIPLFTRYLYQTGCSPVQVAGIRCYLVAVMALIGLIVSKDIRRFSIKNIPFYLIYGILAIGGTFLAYAISIERLSTATAAILLYTAPAFVNILNWVIYKIPLTRIKITSLILTFLGCALVSEVYDIQVLKGNAVGIIVGILAGFLYSLTTVFGAKANKIYSGRMNGFLVQIFGAVLFLFILPPQKIFEIGLSVQQEIFFVALALLSTFIPYTLYLYALGLKIDSGLASVMTNLEPVMATVYGMIILRENIGFIQLVGIFVVFVGVTIPILKREGENV